MARPSHAVVEVCVGLPPLKELPRRETIVHYCNMVLYTIHVIQNYMSPAFPEEEEKKKRKMVKVP